MKTVEQILEAVTAGGKWDYNGEKRAVDAMGVACCTCWVAQDADYVARACSTWPALVKALDTALRALEKPECRWGNGEALEAVRAALAEALKE